MPELPEVETTRRGIAPYLEGQRVSRVVVRERRLRWPIPEDLDVRLSGQRFVVVERRAKYLLLQAEAGTLISHLGMSGSLRLVEAGLEAARHEHVDIELESGLALRYTDPRRFGALLWSLSLWQAAGGTIDDICRVDVYVRNMEHFDAIHKVRAQYFKEPLPASTMVEINKMTSPDYLIEINAIAVIP